MVVNNNKNKNGFRTIFGKRLQVYSKAWISYEKMARKLFVFHGKSGLLLLKLNYSWDLPDPCRPSIFLVKGKMGPNLTHNKRYLLYHDELLNPAKTIKSYQKFLIC